MKPEEKGIQKFDFLTNYMSVNIRKVLLALDGRLKNNTQEIRLRVNSPVILSTGNKNTTVADLDKPPFIIGREDINATFEYVCGSSIHSIIDQLKNGFITIAARPQSRNMRKNSNKRRRHLYHKGYIVN